MPAPTPSESHDGRPDRRDELLALAGTVARLRSEVDGLRHVLRTQAVVEQAKGMLAAQLECTPDEALSHLAELATRNSVKLLDVCAALLGASVPPQISAEEVLASRGVSLPVVGAVHGAAQPVVVEATATRTPEDETLTEVGESSLATAVPPGAAEDGENVELGAPHAAEYYKALATLDTASSLEDLADALLRAARSALGAVAVVFQLAEPEGSLRLVASAGAHARTELEWQRTPAHVTTLAMTAVRSGRAQWLSRLAGTEGVVLIDQPGWAARAWIPIRDDGVVIGAAGVFWPVERDFDPGEQQYLSALVRAAGPRLLALVEKSELPAVLPDWNDWVQVLLDGMPGSVGLIIPMRDDKGEVADFVFRAVSPDAVDVGGRRGRDIIGSRLLEHYPGVAATELWSGLLRVYSTGVGENIGPFLFPSAFADQPQASWFSVRVSKFGDGLLMAWEQHDDAVITERRLGQLQRLANVGWGEWSVTSDGVSWSEQMYKIFDRDPERGPLSLTDLTSVVLTQDLPVLSAALDSLVERAQRVETRFRIAVTGSPRHLRMVAEPVMDGTSRPVLVRGIVQDVTQEHQTREQVQNLQQRLTAQSRDLAEGHRLAAALQHALLPLPRTAFMLPGVQVAVRYVPAEQLAYVGGDWYHARELPDGSVLLAIGDVVGHGVPAAATMAELRNALAGAAMVSAEPAEVLTALNELLVSAPELVLATAVVCRYEPEHRRLTWAQAGHLAPLLSRDGRAKPLSRPSGLMLGVSAGAEYGRAVVDLQRGDFLLLFTDGLVEDRHADLTTGIARLCRTAEQLGVDATADDVTTVLASLRRANPADDACALGVFVRS